MSTGVARAREELFAAHLLSTTGFAAQAVALAFRAARSAAEAALLLVDRAPPPEDPAVVAAFVQHVVRGRGLDPTTGRLLRSLLNRCALADADADVPQTQAPTAIADATTVVDVVAEWLDVSHRVARERAGGEAAARPPARRRQAARRPDRC